MKVSSLILLPVIFGIGCARTDVYFPPMDGKVVYDAEGGTKAPSYHRAVVLNGSDSLGNTEIEVTRNSVRFASAGGIDNSTSTREGYRTVRYGIGAAALTAGTAVVAAQAASAYSANQAAAATSNQAAARSAAAIAASRSATQVKLAEIAAAKAAAAAAVQPLPAAGATIPAQIPAIVTPVVP
jgi:hypothetical protein